MQRIGIQTRDSNIWCRFWKYFCASLHRGHIWNAIISFDPRSNLTTYTALCHIPIYGFLLLLPCSLARYKMKAKKKFFLRGIALRWIIPTEISLLSSRDRVLLDYLLIRYLLILRFHYMKNYSKINCTYFITISC